jgi:chromosome segregation ATPase
VLNLLHSFQDEKVQNLQRTNGNKQQSLATSQQKVSELEKRIAELTKRNEELVGSKDEADRLRAGIQEREAEEVRLRGIEDRLTSEVNDYQKRFADLEGDLESMKVVVGREMQDASDKLKTANEEKQHLAEERDRLLNLIKDMSSKDRAATPTRNNVNGVHSHIPTPYTNSNLNNFPPAPSTYGPSRPITPHYAGSSAMTARYTPSPTPSKMREVQEDDSGWWS